MLTSDSEAALSGGDGMKTNALKALSLITALIVFGLPDPSFAFRCGTELASEGDTKFEINNAKFRLGSLLALMGHGVSSQLYLLTYSLPGGQGVCSVNLDFHSSRHHDSYRRKINI